VKVERRLELLAKLDTKKLIERMHQLEDSLFTLLMDQANYYAEHADDLARGGNDSPAIKVLEAELLWQCPEAKEGKKLTVAEKEAWLLQQRKGNKALAEAVERQKQASFQLDSNQATVEVVKQEMQGVRAVITLKTAQINFLSGGE